MKNYRLFAAMTVLIGISTVTSGATASPCTDKPGYVYVWASCARRTSDKPKNLCEKSVKSSPGLTYFLTEVFLDTPHDGKLPSVQFSDKLKERYGVRLNGTTSFCYPSLKAAKKSRHESKKLWKRSSGLTIFRYVYPDK